MGAAAAIGLWLAHGQLSAAPGLLSADSIEAREGLTVASGHVNLQLGELTLHTEVLRYHPDSGDFEVPGSLFAVEGTTLLVAAQGRGKLAGLEQPSGTPPDLVLEQVRIDELLRLPAGLGQTATSAEEVRAAGPLLLSVSGRELRRLGPRRYTLDGVRLTACACPGPERCRPDWSLLSARADIHAGEFAMLEGPAVEVLGVGIPVLRPPALYLPLAHRRTGFLLPHVNWQAQNGLVVDEPFFLALSESADLTFALGGLEGQSEVSGPATNLGAALAARPAAGPQGSRVRPPALSFATPQTREPPAGCSSACSRTSTTTSTSLRASRSLRRAGCEAACVPSRSRIWDPTTAIASMSTWSATPAWRAS